ncbi:hypothetical protein E2562_002626 [Oryza meyeriana var. granulata]|uniref:Uncharacterized protein n=1 Tax=Oryza meyeriana var. granulata TaxID=110450 RepID=A0A6G1F367_9ORYZ|nr:hypothetical protein E2562_002626 [Oryza meyeriana var. granulata]
MKRHMYAGFEPRAHACNIIVHNRYGVWSQRNQKYIRNTLVLQEVRQARFGDVQAEMRLQGVDKAARHVNVGSVHGAAGGVGGLGGTPAEAFPPPHARSD